MRPTSEKVTERGEAIALAVPPVAASEGHAIPALPAARETRRLRYYRDLLLQGYRSAMNVEPPSTTLRTERIALGIDLPELDAVSSWSTRRKDGSVSIAFIEYALTQARGCLDDLRRAAAPGPEKSELLRQVRALDRLLEEASFYGAGPSALPRLGDLFLPAGLVSRLCAPGGLLDRVVDRCEAILWKGVQGGRD